MSRPQRAVDPMLEQMRGAVRTTFELMEVAEEEIAAAKKRHPKQANLLWRCFGMLCPIGGMTEQIYRAHARELLERVAAGVDARPATRAEVVLQLSRASLVAPPVQRYAALYHALFHQLFPGKVEGTVEEPWKGSNDELLAELQRKFSDEKRVLS